MPDKFRTLAESSAFRREVAALIPHSAYADTVLESILTEINHSPEQGLPTSRSEVVMIITEPTPALPSVVIYYSYTEDTVLLLSVQKADPASEEWSSRFR